MKYPSFLQEGGTIGFVAPSFGCAIEPYRTAFANALNKWENMGYRTALGPNCYESGGIGISSTPESCGREWTQFYMSTENDCLISCGGGELMCEILDFVDFQALEKARPKWFMGYSDNTNLTYLLPTLLDTASIYGPCAAAFGMEPWHESLQDAMGILTGGISEVAGYPLWEKESLKNEENPLAPYHVTQPRRLRCFTGEVMKASKGGRPSEAAETDGELSFSGRLLGGCLDCLVNLLGTVYDKTESFAEKYREDGIIWFLEACDLNVFGIRRAMWQMEHAGWFRYVKGFLVGRPYCFGQELMGLDACGAFLEVAGRLRVPVIMDVDLGHLPPMMPLITGSLGHVTVSGGNMRIAMEMK